MPNLSASPSSDIHIGISIINTPALIPVTTNINSMYIHPSTIKESKTCTVILYGKRSHRPGRQAQNKQNTEWNRNVNTLARYHCYPTVASQCIYATETSGACTTNSRYI